MKSWKSILFRLFLLPLAFASTLLAGGEFRLSHRTFENTRLGPVLAQAAYMQTYEYHIQDPVFEKEFPLLDLWISFRGDLRFFAVFYNDEPLVAGVRSHRPDALIYRNPGFLREFVVFNINLEERKFQKSFLLFERNQQNGEPGILEKERCTGNGHWKPRSEYHEMEGHPHPAALADKDHTSEVSADHCDLPLTLQYWLEFIRQSKIPVKNLDKTVRPA